MQPSRAYAFGAHVGVHVGDDAVLHLSAEAGRPEVWTYAELTTREVYRTCRESHREVSIRPWSAVIRGGCSLLGCQSAQAASGNGTPVVEWQR